MYVIQKKDGRPLPPFFVNTKKNRYHGSDYQVAVYSVSHSVESETVVRPFEEKSGPVYSVMRLRFRGTLERTADPRIVPSAFLQLSVTFVVHSSSVENPKMLRCSLVTPISDEGILIVMVCEGVAEIGSPVV